MLKLINKKFFSSKILINNFGTDTHPKHFEMLNLNQVGFGSATLQINKRGRGKKGDKKAEEKSAKEKPGYRLKILNIDSLK
jgi:hypothetical protein